MTQIVINPSPSGTGQFSINAPVSNNNRSFALPDLAGQVIVDQSNSGALTIDTAGNAGLGITPSAWAVHKALEGTSGALSFEGNNYLFTASNTYRGSGGFLYTRTGLVTTLFEQGVEGFKWRTAPSGTAGAAITFTMAASISNAGNFSFNSGYGSAAVAYGCRAWVNFNGTGTVAIRGSGNVSSITDGGVGTYTINFTTAMPDANYSYPTSASDGGTNFGVSVETATTSGYTIQSQNTNSGNLYDAVFISSAVFR